MGNTRSAAWLLRREDTPLFVSDTQLSILQIVANEKDPTQLHQVTARSVEHVAERLSDLSHQEIPLNELIVT